MKSEKCLDGYKNWKKGTKLKSGDFGYETSLWRAAYICGANSQRQKSSDLCKHLAEHIKNKMAILLPSFNKGSYETSRILEKEIKNIDLI